MGKFAFVFNSNYCLTCLNRSFSVFSDNTFMPKAKVKKTQPVKPEATPQPSAPVTTSPTPEGEPCPPDLLLEFAERESVRRVLADYNPVIRTLRDEKNFTFREIAAWLKEYNVQADHNAVYREYTKGMPDDLARDEAEADEHIEQEESGQQ